MIKEKIIQVEDYLVASKLPSCDFVINPYIGCPHGCKYCYACFMNKFTGHDEEWGTFIDIKESNKSIDLNKIKNKVVFMSSVTDCYNPMEEKYKLTRNILKQLIKSECTLNISTKSSLILRDLDLLKQIKKISVAISINTLDEKFKNDMDNASSIGDRINTLKILHQNGIKTILFMSPIFPEITDFKAIIKETNDYVDEYWFENLNLRGSYKKTILEYIKEKYPQYYSIYNDIYDNNDDAYWRELESEIEEYCVKNKISFHNYVYHDKLVKDKQKNNKESYNKNNYYE